MKQQPRPFARTKEQKLLYNHEDLQKCIDEFFNQAGLAEVTDTLGFLLTTFAGDKENDWFRDCITETTLHTTDIITFLSKVYELKSRRESILLSPEEVAA